MQPRRRLFLIGGSPALEVVADAFVAAAGGRKADIALLLQGGPGWEQYLPTYVEPWRRRGVARIHPIAPDEGGEPDLEHAATIIRGATGLFVGGGHTPTYQRLYAELALGALLRQQYLSGVPYAGLSAGAMIALDPCVLVPQETEDGHLQLAPGLGLLTGCLMAPHFTELDALPTLLESIARTRIGTGWGVDEPACAVFENEAFAGVLGRAVTRVTMADFQAWSYTLHEEMTPYPGPLSSA